MLKRLTNKVIADKTDGRLRDTAGESREDLIADPNWVDIESLPFAADQYFCVDVPRHFRDAMIKDAKNWAESSASDARTWAIRAITKAVSRVVMPRIIDLRDWRDHVARHLNQLCLHRRRFESDTISLVEKLAEKCEFLEAQVSRFQSKWSRHEEDTDKIIQQLQERCTLTNDQVLLLQGKVSSLESTSTSCQNKTRTQRPARTRSRSPEAQVSSHREPRDMIFEAQLEAIKARSQSPGPDRARAWCEFSNRELLSSSPNEFSNREM